MLKKVLLGVVICGLCLLSAGQALAAWSTPDPVVPDLAIVARNARTRFGAAQPISSPADDAGAPVVAGDARGGVAALWQDLGPSASENSALTQSPLEFADLGG